MTIRDKLLHAVTDYDRKQSKRKHHNPYALGIYFERINMVCGDMEKGLPVRRALCRAFNDRLLDHCLKAVGEKPFTMDEVNQNLTYTPL